MEVRPRLISLLGPTAAGKSAVAMLLARRIGGEILSLDSMQVYRGMDIGTAKPTAAEQGNVRHHLIDVAGPGESFTAARFVQLADGVIADAHRRGVTLICVGGTPLYYKALFTGLFEGPSADESLRERLRQFSPAELHEKLRSADPEAAARIHGNDQRRVIRALEVYELTGRTISSHQTEWAAGAQRHQAAWFGLHWEREVLNRRINSRVRQMIDAGWVEEVRRLLETGLSLTAGEATGYGELIEYLQGRIGLGEAIEQIKIATRQLARRQMKWMRRFPNVTWLRGDQDANDLVTAISD